MRKLFRALLTLVLSLCALRAWADFTLDLGAISASQAFILGASNPMNSNCTFDLVGSDDRVIVSGSIQVGVCEAIPSDNGPVYVYTYHSSATSSVPGVSIVSSGSMNTDLEITGLPSDSYRIKCYASWGNASTSVQLYGPYNYGGTTNFGAVDEYGSALLFFDMFVF
jgi:hypothetical protein